MGSIQSRREALSPTPHLSVDQYVRVLNIIEDDGGFSSINDITMALPGVAQPISAILDLCDAGVLSIDLAACFDGNIRVWRSESRAMPTIRMEQARAPSARF